MGNENIDRLREAFECVLWPTQLEQDEASAALDALADHCELLEASLRIEKRHAEQAERELDEARRECIPSYEGSSR